MPGFESNNRNPKKEAETLCYTLQKVITSELCPMRVTEDGDRLNNYASEPKAYAAEPMTEAQKKTYIAIGVGSLMLIGGMVAIATFVS
jgi:hypothetical protein